MGSQACALIGGTVIVAITMALGCGQEHRRVLPFPMIPQEDAGADPGSDADSDAEADADSDPDGPGVDDHRLCRADSDCTIAIDVDLCCACPRAVTVEQEAVDPCLEPYPAADPAHACRRECSTCPEPACPIPRAAVCRGSECVLVYPGSCVDAADCAQGEICRFADGETRCIGRDGGGCQEDGDCEVGTYCALGLAGERICEALEPGECARPQDCDGEPCDRTDAYVPGRCRS